MTAVPGGGLFVTYLHSLCQCKVQMSGSLQRRNVGLTTWLRDGLRRESDRLVRSGVSGHCEPEASARVMAPRIRFFCRIVRLRLAKRWRSHSCWSRRILLSTTPSRLSATMAPCVTWGFLSKKKLGRGGVCLRSGLQRPHEGRLGPGLRQVHDPIAVESQLSRQC